MSKSFTAWGKGNMINVQNALTDYRVKSIDNDIGVAVEASFEAIGEAARIAAAVSGVPLPALTANTPAATGESAKATPAAPSTQASTKIAAAQTVQVNSIRANLNLALADYIQRYSTAKDDKEKANIKAEAAGRIKRAIDDLNALIAK